jgi:hypothetical protein
MIVLNLIDKGGKKLRRKRERKNGKKKKNPKDAKSFEIRPDKPRRGI